MNSPTATTSIAIKLKRFKEKNRIEPPRIQLVCEGQQGGFPAYCDKRHINSIPENPPYAIKSRPDLTLDKHLSFP
jgi:hypothetical protein